MNTVCVLGLGYIGLPTAGMLATHGLRVIGVDVDSHVLEVLRSGEVHLGESGLKALIQEAMQSGNLVIRSAPEPADAFIIAVPTPINPDKTSDLRAVTSATESILPHLRRGTLVVLESTSPPGTTAGLVRTILERSGLKAGRDFGVAYSPERVLLGRVLKELVENTRVIGGLDRASAESARDLYATFVKGEVLLTDATTAEMVKLMENTSRDINIALANQFALIAERLGVNVWEAIGIANRHPRVSILRPGPGVGGHCIAVDPWFLVEAAPEQADLIRHARMLNDNMPAHVVKLVQRATADIQRPRIACLGLAFKADVDDIRESPAVRVAQLLVEAGAAVKAHDPCKPEARVPGVVTVPVLEEALADVDVLLLLTGHRQLREMEPGRVAALTRARVAVDAVNGWDAQKWVSEGFRVVCLGK